MAKFFTFADRAIPVQFFGDDPIQLTLIASDEMDAKILDAYKLIAEGDQQTNPEDRKAKYRQAVDSLIGHDVADQILARTDNADGYALCTPVKGVDCLLGRRKICRCLAGEPDLQKPLWRQGSTQGGHAVGNPCPVVRPDRVDPAVHHQGVRRVP